MRVVSRREKFCVALVLAIVLIFLFANKEELALAYSQGKLFRIKPEKHFVGPIDPQKPIQKFEMTRNGEHWMTVNSPSIKKDDVLEIAFVSKGGEQFRVTIIVK